MVFIMYFMIYFQFFQFNCLDLLKYFLRKRSCLPFSMFLTILGLQLPESSIKPEITLFLCLELGLS